VVVVLAAAVAAVLVVAALRAAGNCYLTIIRVITSSLIILNYLKNGGSFDV
jgi:hypothetical protein